LTNIGTLFAFVLVCIGITILRRRDPDRPRPFRVPFGAWLLPGLGVVSCLFLMFYLPPASWWRFFGWLMLGLAVYAGYGCTHSALARQTPGVAPKAPAVGRVAPALRLASLAFLVAAGGQFIMPHRVRVHAILGALADPSTPEHTRAMIGVALTTLGVVVGTAALRRGLAPAGPRGIAPAAPQE
jgi:APA family basic amino acid/polyamine antiporter